MEVVYWSTNTHKPLRLRRSSSRQSSKILRILTTSLRYHMRVTIIPTREMYRYRILSGTWSWKIRSWKDRSNYKVMTPAVQPRKMQSPYKMTKKIREWQMLRNLARKAARRAYNCPSIFYRTPKLNVIKPQIFRNNRICRVLLRKRTQTSRECRAVDPKDRFRPSRTHLRFKINNHKPARLK